MTEEPADPSTLESRAPLTVGLTPVLPALSVAPKFCRACGRPWDPAWSDCPSCPPAVAGMTAPGARRVAHLQDDDERPRIRSVLTLYFSLLAVSVLGLIAGLAGAPELRLDIGLGIGMSVVVIVWLLAVGRKPVLMQLLKPAAPQWFLLAAFGGLLTFALAFGVIEALHRFTGLEKLGYTDTYFNNGFGIGMVVLMICVQPAVFEEIAFRGVILTSLQPTLSVVEAVVVSALLFMILHLSPAMFPHTLALGLACGFLRTATGSLLPCILMHFVHNLMCIVTETALGV